MYDHTIKRSLWFSTREWDSLAHTVARELIQKGRENDAKGLEALLWITRRYE